MALLPDAPVARPTPSLVADVALSNVRQRVPVAVWALSALHVALMLMCSLLYPTMYGYDEPQHVDMAYAYSKAHWLYDPGDRQLSRGVRNAERGPGYPPTRPFPDVPVVPRQDRLPFDRQGGDVPYAASLPNQMVQHPPLYYLLAAGVLRLPGVPGLPYDQQVWLLRLLSMLLLAPLPLLAWAAASTLLGPGPPGLVAAVLPVSIPGLTRVGASANNDALLIALASVLVLLLARVLAGDLGVRTGALVGAVLAAALLTKGFGLVLPPVAGAAYVVAGLRHRSWPVLPAASMLAVTGLGALWWMRNLLLYGQVQPAGYGADVYARIIGPQRPGGPPLQFAPGFAYRMSLRVWGGIGLPEGPQLTPLVTTGWAVALVLLVGAGVAVGTRGRWGRTCLAVLTLPAVLMLGLVATQTYQLFAGYGGIWMGIQGRYLYLGIVGLAVPFGAGLVGVVQRLSERSWERAGARLLTWLPAGVLVLALLTHAVAWRTIVQAWWVPAAADGPGDAARGALAGIAAWSPFPAVATFPPFVLVAVLGVVAVALAVPQRDV